VVRDPQNYDIAGELSMPLLNLLIFKGSRKVSFGLYLFLTANIGLWLKVIQSNDWMTCMLLSSALIGGGTVADKFLENRVPKPPVV
jgi:hypothetical protein